MLQYFISKLIIIFQEKKNWLLFVPGQVNVGQVGSTHYDPSIQMVRPDPTHHGSGSLNLDPFNIKNRVQVEVQHPDPTCWTWPELTLPVCQPLLIQNSHLSKKERAPHEALIMIYNLLRKFINANLTN